MAEKQLSKMNEQERFEAFVNIHEAVMRHYADQLGMSNPVITVSYQGKEVRKS